MYTTEERLRRVICDTNNTDPVELTLNATFDELGYGDLDLVELLLAVEKEFGIEVPDEDFEKWTCAQDALNYIEAKVK